VLAASQTTDDQGNYAIDGLSAGSYHVVTRNSQGFIDEGATGQACPSSCAPTTTTPISVAISQQQQLDFALLPGAVISGRVTDQASGALPSVEVTVYTDTGVEVASAITDASGNYSIRSLLPDDYVAATTSNPHGLRNRLYDDLPCDAGCNVLAGTLITLGSGAQANGIDFVLPDGKSISGVLTRTSGNPLGGVRVAAFDAAGTEVASAQSGPSGAFTITGLPDGVYQLRTFNTIGLVDQAIGGDECTPLDCDLALATSFDVTGASQTGADATLRSGQVPDGGRHRREQQPDLQRRSPALQRAGRVAEDRRRSPTGRLPSTAWLPAPTTRWSPTISAWSTRPGRARVCRAWIARAVPA
jgi:molybdopterin-binding protein